VIDEVSAASAGREDLYGLARTVYADPTQAMMAAAAHPPPSHHTLRRPRKGILGTLVQGVRTS
jgi:hypothetical protein